MNAAVRVTGFAAALAAVFGIAWAAGAAVGPVVDDEPEPMAGHGMTEEAGHEETSEHLPDGLSVAQGDYRLVLAGDGLAFTIEGPDGAPVTAYDVEHEKRLHLIVVRRDFTGYQHLHPVLDESTGRWSTGVDLEPGTWRVFADFVPTGGEDLTLGADLVVPGPAPAAAPAEVTRTDEVGPYTVRVSGDLVSGTTASCAPPSSSWRPREHQ